MPKKLLALITLIYLGSLYFIVRPWVGYIITPEAYRSPFAYLLGSAFSAYLLLVPISLGLAWWKRARRGLCAACLLLPVLPVPIIFIAGGFDVYLCGGPGCTGRLEAQKKPTPSPE